MRLASFGIFLVSCAVFGQTFDVASVKPSAPPDASGRVIFRGAQGGPGTSDPGQITWNNAVLMAVLTDAYDVRPYQVRGPDWLGTERYDIIAKLPMGATKEQVKVMWQNLLKERFGLTLHREPKEFSGEELTVAKGGPKLKATELAANAGQFEIPPGPPKLDKDGFPQLSGSGIIGLISPGANGAMTAHVIVRGQTMEQFAQFLGNKHPVVDKTGLTGRYDFNLEFTPELDLPPGPPPPGGGPAQAGTPNDPGTNAASAVAQLGLKLTSTKVTIDVLVIDHAEKTPAEN